MGKPGRPKNNEIDNKRSLSSFKIPGYQYNYIDEIAKIWETRPVYALRWIIQFYIDKHPIENEINERRKKLETDWRKLDEYIEIGKRNRAEVEAQIIDFRCNNKYLEKDHEEAAIKVFEAFKKSVMREIGVGSREFDDMCNKIIQNEKS
jgi:hypothetical protein